jgi:hypothetical protein
MVSQGAASFHLSHISNGKAALFWNGRVVGCLPSFQRNMTAAIFKVKMTGGRGYGQFTKAGLQVNNEDTAGLVMAVGATGRRSGE